DMGAKPVTTAAREYGQNGQHERLFFDDIVVREAGYMYIYLSNESEYLVDVFFDDLKVTHAKSPIVQVDDYYPFGLTFNSYQRENSVENRWKFQGQEHIDDLGLNWDSFKWRNHQPDIGRFFNVDPLAEDYYYNSPYAFSENKVVAHVELEGLEAAQVNIGIELIKIGVESFSNIGSARDRLISGRSGEVPNGVGMGQTTQQIVKIGSVAQDANTIATGAQEFVHASAEMSANGLK